MHVSDIIVFIPERRLDAEIDDISFRDVIFKDIIALLNKVYNVLCLYGNDIINIEWQDSPGYKLEYVSIYFENFTKKSQWKSNELANCFAHPPSLLKSSYSIRSVT